MVGYAGQSVSPTVSELTAALRYAARGWPVAAIHRPVVRDSGRQQCRTCDPERACPWGEKHPCGWDSQQHLSGASWAAVATTDAAVLGQWWQEHPEAAVGLVTGAHSALVALEVQGAAEYPLADIAPQWALGATASQIVRRIEAFVGPLESTVRWNVGRDRAVLIFAHDGALPSAAPFVRTRLVADGGLVVAPSSLMVDGKTRRGIPAALPPLPPPLRELVLGRPRDQTVFNLDVLRHEARVDPYPDVVQAALQLKSPLFSAAALTRAMSGSGRKQRAQIHAAAADPESRLRAVQAKGGTRYRLA